MCCCRVHQAVPQGEQGTMPLGTAVELCDSGCHNTCCVMLGLLCSAVVMCCKDNTISRGYKHSKG